MSPSYEFHVFVCQNQKTGINEKNCCLAKGAEEIWQLLKQRAQELGIPNIRINKSGCLGQCGNGPAVVVYPEGIWYKLNNKDDVEKVVQEHFVNKLPLKSQQI